MTIPAAPNMVSASLSAGVMWNSPAMPSLKHGAALLSPLPIESLPVLHE
jgi:hypothetical protein